MLIKEYNGVLKNIPAKFVYDASPEGCNISGEDFEKQYAELLNAVINKHGPLVNFKFPPGFVEPDHGGDDKAPANVDEEDEEDSKAAVCQDNT